MRCVTGQMLNVFSTDVRADGFDFFDEYASEGSREQLPQSEVRVLGDTMEHTKLLSTYCGPG